MIQLYMVSVSVKSVFNLVVFVACVVTCFFVHMACQRMYYEYCVSNIFLVFLFKTSNFCIILGRSARAIEIVLSKFLV